MAENLPFTFEIALVANNHHGEVVLVLYTQDLLLEDSNFLKTLARCDGVDKQKSFSSAHVLLAHGAVLFLAGGIENVEESDFIIDDALLAIRVYKKKRHLVSHLFLFVGCQALLVSDAPSLAQRPSAPTFDCRVIFVDKVALDKLDGQARFAYTTTADDDELVFSHELY